jgi:hypothetical protein
MCILSGRTGQFRGDSIKFEAFEIQEVENTMLLQFQIEVTLFTSGPLEARYHHFIFVGGTRNFFRIRHSPVTIDRHSFGHFGETRDLSVDLVGPKTNPRGIPTFLITANGMESTEGLSVLNDESNS